MNWRVVYNAQTERYRIELRRWWGWDFVANQTTGAYVAFDDYAAAGDWACRRLVRKDRHSRRWRALSICDCHSSSV